MRVTRPDDDPGGQTVGEEEMKLRMLRHLEDRDVLAIATFTIDTDGFMRTYFDIYRTLTHHKSAILKQLKSLAAKLEQL